MAALAPLILIIMALGVMLRLVKPGRIGRYIVGLVLTPVVIAIGFATTRDVYSNLTLSGKLIVLASIPAVLAGLGVYLLPRHIRERILNDFIYEALKLVILMPFWLLARISSTLFSPNRTAGEPRSSGASRSRGSGLPSGAAGDRADAPTGPRSPR